MFAWERNINKRCKLRNIKTMTAKLLSSYDIHHFNISKTSKLIFNAKLETKKNI